MDNKSLSLYFELFNEIGIIDQLASAHLGALLPDGVLISQFSVLNHLIRVADGRTPLQLAQSFQVPKTTMTHTLSGLEKRALISIRPNPRDGRSKCVWLTSEGRVFRDAAIHSLDAELAEFGAHFPPEKIGDLVSRLAEIRKFLDQLRNEKSIDE